MSEKRMKRPSRSRLDERFGEMLAKRVPRILSQIEEHEKSAKSVAASAALLGSAALTYALVHNYRNRKIDPETGQVKADAVYKPYSPVEEGRTVSDRPAPYMRNSVTLLDQDGSGIAVPRSEWAAHRMMDNPGGMDTFCISRKGKLEKVDLNDPSATFRQKVTDNLVFIRARLTALVQSQEEDTQAENMEPFNTHHDSTEV